MLTRYDDVYNAFGDHRLGNQPAETAVVHGRNRQHYLCADVASRILPFQEGEEHRRNRKLLTRHFHEHLQQSAPNMTAMARLQLKGFMDQGELDILEDFATPFSLDVMCQILGLSLGDKEALKSWSNSFFYLFAPIPSLEILHKVEKDLEEFRDYLKKVVEARNENRKDDLISRIVNSGDDKELGIEALVDNLMLFFSDGIENVDAAIASTILLLLKNKNQFRKLRRNPLLMNAAIEESLRLEAPAQYITRIASETFNLHDKDIEAGSPVILTLASANRDSERFTDAEVFKLDRAESQLGFGKGRHSCIGARLVKWQMHEALTVLVQSCPDMALTRAPQVWRQRMAHRWLRELVVTF